MIDSTIKSSARQGALTLSRLMTPSVLAAFGVLAIAVLTLFTAPYVGMADNGDFFRSIYSNGLYFNLPDYDSRYFGYFVRQFGIFQYYNENGAMLHSSQTLFIKLAIGLNKLFFSGTVFDIRFQAAIYTCLYVAAVYLLVEGLTVGLSRRQGMGVALLALFVFGDTGYIAYFNSFYSESPALIMMLLMFASWLLLCRKRYNDYVMLALFWTSSLVLTTAKQQNAPVGFIIALLSLSLLWMRGNRLFRLLVLSSSALLLAAGLLTYFNISKEFVNINQYHAMTRGVLKESSDPEETLKSFGINEQYAILKDSIYYERYGTVDVDSPLLEKEFYSQYGFASVLKYYIAHPDKLGSILNVAAKNAFSIKPAAMGNFEKSAGKEFREQSHWFSLYSLLKEKLAPKTFGFIVIWTLVTIGVYIPSFFNAWRARNGRGMQRLALIAAAILIGLSGIAVSIIGAGDADIAKHEFLFTLSFDLVSVMTLSSIIGRSLFKDRQPAVPTVPAPAPEMYVGDQKSVGA